MGCPTVLLPGTSNGAVASAASSSWPFTKPPLMLVVLPPLLAAAAMATALAVAASNAVVAARVVAAAAAGRLHALSSAFCEAWKRCRKNALVTLGTGGTAACFWGLCLACRTTTHAAFSNILQDNCRYRLCIDALFWLCAAAGGTCATAYCCCHSSFGIALHYLADAYGFRASMDIYCSYTALSVSSGEDHLGRGLLAGEDEAACCSNRPRACRGSRSLQ